MEMLLAELNKNTADLQSNYESLTEPSVLLLARFPNLLVNLALQGIAVGMHNNIPPHNLGN